MLTSTVYSRPLLYLLVFCGGFANLASEIIGPRLFASLFGSTTVIWAVMISVTLLGLAVGYALGGRVPHASIGATLPVVLIINAIWLVLVSWVVWQLPATFARAGIGIDITIILLTIGAAFFVPSVLFGSISPMVITLLTAGQSSEDISRIVGNVYGLGTVGSVAGAVSAAFIFIPWIGLATSLQIFAVGLVLFAAYFWRTPGRWRVGAALLVCILLPQPVYYWEDDEGLELLAQREGYYQTIRVYSDNETFVQMHLGPTFQSRLDLQTGEPAFTYAETLVELAGDVSGQNVLVIGGAGHALAHTFERRGATVTEVEIDPFVVELSDRYFGEIEGEVIIADGRIYIEQAAPAQFDLIVIDAFDGAANVPPQLTTLEFFDAVEKTLKPDGRMLYNFIGTPEGARSGSFRAISTTLQAAFPAAGASAYDGEQSQNIILAASPTALDGLPVQSLPDDGILLTDNRNPMEILLSQARNFFYFRY